MVGSTIHASGEILPRPGIFVLFALRLPAVDGGRDVPPPGWDRSPASLRVDAGHQRAPRGGPVSPWRRNGYAPSGGQ